MAKANKTKIWLGIITTVGVIAVALFANWDKVFPEKDETKEIYKSYRITGDYETEVRIFFEVSGLRQAIETQFEQEEQIIRDLLSADMKGEGAEVKKEFLDKIIKLLKEEMGNHEKHLKKMLPIYRKYYSIEEIQELNKFFSTEIMQSRRKKDALVQKEAEGIKRDFYENWYKQIKKEKEIAEDKELEKLFAKRRLELKMKEGK